MKETLESSRTDNFPPFKIGQNSFSRIFMVLCTDAFTIISLANIEN